MIPLRASERLQSATPVTASIIAVNVMIFLYQFALPQYALTTFVDKWGVVPDRINAHLISLLTSMFLHAGWAHLLGNMLFLWVFGRPTENLIGRWQFLAFYLLCGVAAAIVHVLSNAYSPVPTIGASGAIAGVMGAYLIKFPKSYIDTLVWFIFISRIEIPAPYFLIYWFVIQLFSGVGSISEVDYTGGGVAWFAHIGGFLAGMGLIYLFRTKPRWRAWYEED